MVATLTPKTTLARTGEVPRQWYVVDADGAVLGRLAAAAAMMLMGKHKPQYTPHIDTGDFIVVVNADRIKLTGRKLDNEVHQWYTYYPGGQKQITFGQMRERHPERLIRLAVRRMLPKNKLAKTLLTKLKIYRGPDHPHQAQQPKKLDLSKGLKAAMTAPKD